MANLKRESSLAAMLGFGVWVLLGTLAVSGIALATQYAPIAGGAHASVVAMRDSPVHSFLCDYHYYGSGVAIALAAVNLAFLLWAGRYGRPDRWLWWGALGALIITMLAQVTGNLLPFSQHDVRTAFAEGGIAAQTPLIGPTLRAIAIGGEAVGQETVDRWYFAHRFVAPLLLVLLAFPAIRSLRREGLKSKLWWAILVPAAIAAAGALIVSGPLGNAALPSDLATGATRPMWYVLPMHALLDTLGGINPSMGWIGAMLVPGLAVTGLMMLPILVRKSAEGAAFGRIAVLFGSVLLILAIITYGDRVQGPFADEPTFDAPRAAPEPTQTPNLPLAEQGKLIYDANKCSSCHAIGGAGSATAGPNLAGVGSRRPNVEELMDLVRDPQAFGIQTMPAYSALSLSELRALAEYLSSLK